MHNKHGILAAALLALAPAAANAQMVQQDLQTGMELAATGVLLARAAAAAPSADARASANVSTERREVINETGIPAPYFRYSNPLPRTQATLRRGGQIYAQRCAGCHGSIVMPGSGADARDLSPQPTDLMALRQLSPRTRDAYMYWTIAEGGVAYATTMPAYKTVLPKKDIWSVIRFVRASVDR
jgi:mono/diheme cytochrome c family protein